MSQLSSLAVNEGVSSGALVGTFSTIDADGIGVFTYALVSGTGSADISSFSIDSDGN